MSITDVKVRKMFETGPMKAVVSITLDGVFAVHDIKVIKGQSRLFVAMPSRKDESGTYRDIVHPINHDTRQQIEKVVLSAYSAAIADMA